MVGELSAALDTNLRLCSDFPVKTKTPSLYVSGPFSISQLRTGTGEMWATLAISIVKNKKDKTKSRHQQKIHNSVTCTETDEFDSHDQIFGETYILHRRC